MERRKDALAFIIDFEAFVVNADIENFYFWQFDRSKFICIVDLNFYLLKVQSGFYNAVITENILARREWNAHAKEFLIFILLLHIRTLPRLRNQLSDISKPKGNRSALHLILFRLNKHACDDRNAD